MTDDNKEVMEQWIDNNVIDAGFTNFKDPLHKALEVRRPRRGSTWPPPRHARNYQNSRAACFTPCALPVAGGGSQEAQAGHVQAPGEEGEGGEAGRRPAQQLAGAYHRVTPVLHRRRGHDHSPPPCHGFSVPLLLLDGSRSRSATRRSPRPKTTTTPRGTPPRTAARYTRSLFAKSPVALLTSSSLQLRRAYFMRARLQAAARERIERGFGPI